MPKICYIIPSWGGPRRTPDHPDMKKDGALYLRTHVNRIATLCKSIDHILVACPKGYNFYPGYEAYVSSLETAGQVNGVPVEILRRRNIGMSYGALNDVYEKYRTRFDYYIISEDDYLPAIKDLDITLLSMIESSPQCGFLCGLVWTANGCHALHAGVFLGIMRAEALEKVWLKNGSLCTFAGRNDGKEYGEAEISGQVGLSKAILAAGFGLEDWLKTHKSVFLEGKNIKIFGNDTAPAFFLPAQIPQFLTSTPGLDA